MERGFPGFKDVFWWVFVQDWYEFPEEKQKFLEVCNSHVQVNGKTTSYKCKSLTKFKIIQFICLNFKKGFSSFHAFTAELPVSIREKMFFGNWLQPKNQSKASEIKPKPSSNFVIAVEDNKYNMVSYMLAYLMYWPKGSVFFPNATGL